MKAQTQKNNASKATAKTETAKAAKQTPLTPEQITTAFLSKSLLMDGRMNIEIGKKTTAFDMILNYTETTRYNMQNDEIALFDLFHDFNTAKNAICTLYYILEQNAEITPDLLDLQKNLTPTKELPKDKTYLNFLTTLTDDEKKTLIEKAKAYMNLHLNGKTSFESFYTNTIDGQTFEKGDYILGYDPTYSAAIYMKVFEACPNGWVTVLDNGGFFTLSKATEPKKATKEQIPALVSQKLEETYATWIERAFDDREAIQKRLNERKERAALALQKEQEKAEKQAEAEKEKAKLMEVHKATFNELAALPLKTEAQRKEAISKLNLAKLPTLLHKEMSAKIKAAIPAKSSAIAMPEPTQTIAGKPKRANTNAAPKETKAATTKAATKSPKRYEFDEANEK